MGIGIWQLVIIFLIVLLLFGAKRLRNVGGDLGAAIKWFRSAVRDGENESDADKNPERIASEKNGQVIEGEVTSKAKDKT